MLKTKNYILVLTLLLFALASTCYGMELYPHYTYALHTGKEIAVAWDLSEDATYYNVRARIMEQEDVVTNLAWNNIKDTMITMVIPRGGHWEIQVQACNDDKMCSLWSSSTNPDSTPLIGDEPQTWWVYGYLAPPTGGGVE